MAQAYRSASVLRWSKALISRGCPTRVIGTVSLRKPLLPFWRCRHLEILVLVTEAQASEGPQASGTAFHFRFTDAM